MSETLDMATVTHGVITMLSQWGVTQSQQLTLLGLPEATKARAVTRYAQGAPLPEDPEIMMRVRELLAIDSAIASAFPHNPHLATLWVTTPNRSFGDRTPLAVMLEEGLAGIHKVREHLEGSDAW